MFTISNENLNEFKFFTGIGCTAHIVHNAARQACDKLPVDIEATVVKIYSHFYLYSVRTNELQNFCEDVGDNYRKLLGYGKTRFLAMSAALNAILTIWNGLKEYFMKSKSSPRSLKAFFKNPYAKLYLIFAKDQCLNFNETILQLEGEKITAFSAIGILQKLKNQIDYRKRFFFLSAEMQTEINKLESIQAVNRTTLKKIVNQFHGMIYIIHIFYYYFVVFNFRK